MQETRLERGTSGFRRMNAAFFMAGLALFAVLYCTQPLLPVFTHVYHVSPATSSLSLSATTVVLALALPWYGAVSDVAGRTKVMVISLIATSVLAVFTPWCSNFTTMVVLRALQGLVIAGLPAIAMAYISEETAPSSLGFAMGFYISGNSIGGLFGRIMVSTLTDLFNWQVALTVLSVFSLLCALAFWRLLPPSRHFQKQPLNLRQTFLNLRGHLTNARLLGLFSMGALLMGGFVTLYNYIGFRLLAPPYHFSQTAVGWLFLVYLVGTFSSSWMGRFADKRGREVSLWVSLSTMMAGLLLTGFGEVWWILLGMILFTFGFFGAHSVASGWVGKTATRAKAQASSLYLFCYYTGSSVGGSVGGVFWSRSGWNGVLMMIGVLMVGAILVSFFLAGRKDTVELVNKAV